MGHVWVLRAANLGWHHQEEDNGGVPRYLGVSTREHSQVVVSMARDANKNLTPQYGGALNYTEEKS